MLYFNMSTKLPSRVFKTAWFTRAARKARIGDGKLCVAIQQVTAGQAATWAAVFSRSA